MMANSLGVNASGQDVADFASRKKKNGPPQKMRWPNRIKFSISIEFWEKLGEKFYSFSWIKNKDKIIKHV